MRAATPTAIGISRMVRKLARLRPEEVRGLRFPRARFGRRGLSEAQVYAFVRRVVDELVARDAAEAALQDENIRLKEALRAWQTRMRPRNTGRWTEL